MYKCGDFVVYGTGGVCCVEEVSTLDSDAANKDRLYYVFKNIVTNGIAYVPVDSNVYLRPVMSKSEVEALLQKAPALSTDAFEKIPPRELQKVYRDTLLSHDSLAILSLIKHICITSKKKQLLKKKLSITEERFLEQALKIMSSEFSISLGIDLESAKNHILTCLNID